MDRRSLREQVFKVLFRVEFNSEEEMEEQCRLFLEHEDMEIAERDGALITERFQAVQGRLEEIDSLLNERTKGWTTQRMGKVDLAILRLALFEMKFDEAVPEGVAINEAVELAKKFGQEESAGFINGVLARFADKGQN